MLVCHGGELCMLQADLHRQLFWFHPESQQNITKAIKYCSSGYLLMRVAPTGGSWVWGVVHNTPLPLFEILDLLPQTVFFSRTKPIISLFAVSSMSELYFDDRLVCTAINLYYLKGEGLPAKIILRTACY